MAIGMLLAAALSGSAPTASANCPETAGLEDILDRRAPRYLLIGEAHGTNEVPEMFADIVCAASRRGPVTVLLELPAGDQADVDAFLRSRGDRVAREALLAGDFWNRSTQDGRSSAAMLRLVERLRQLRAIGRDIEVVASAPRTPTGTPQSYYELQMAARWTATPPMAGMMAIGLTGAFHARKSPPPAVPDITPAAAHLPAKDLLTFLATGDGGEAWRCASGHCGPSRLAAEPAAPRQPGLVLAPAEGYDGWLVLGRPTTASPPLARGKLGAQRRDATQPATDLSAASSRVMLPLPRRETRAPGGPSSRPEGPLWANCLR